MDSGRVWRQKTVEKSLPAAEQKDVGSYRSATSPDTKQPTRRYTLGKPEILRGYQSFSHVLSHGTYVQHSGIRCYYIAATEIPPASVQVGFAIHGVRKAVLRNSYKRLLRESYRLNKHTLLDCCMKLPTGIRCVFLLSPRRLPETASFHLLNNLIATLIKDLCIRLSGTYATE